MLRSLQVALKVDFQKKIVREIRIKDQGSASKIGIKDQDQVKNVYLTSMRNVPGWPAASLAVT